MAQVSYLRLHQEDDHDDEDLQENVLVTTLDSAPLPLWSHDFDVCPSSDLDFREFPISTVPPQILNDVVSFPDASLDRENQVNFVIDLFHHCVEQSSSVHNNNNQDTILAPSFEVIEVNDELGLNNLDLGLGFAVDYYNGDDNNSGFVVADCGDEFFVSRRVFDAVSDESGESSNSGMHDFFMGGLSVVEIESDLEDGGNESVDDFALGNDNDDDNNENDDEDSSIRICWDSFQLEDGRDVNNIQDFEWEEIDGRVDEREALSTFFDAEGDDDVDTSVVAVRETEEMGRGERSNQTFGNLEWEVLLNVNNLEWNHGLGLDEDGDDGDGYFDHDEYTIAEYETLFGQFAEHENASMGRPPASKSVVENLDSVVLTKEDTENSNALCAVCKDEFNVGERAKQLTCSHRYHGDCIVPWLGIRNTCPICRYELPTDDPDYERRRSQRAAHAQ